jgi:hypothetical protein
MINIPVRLHTGSKSAESTAASQFSLNGFDRFSHDLGQFYSLLIDVHREKNTHFHYLRINPTKKPLSVDFSEYEPLYQMSQNCGFGSLLRAGKKDKKITIWLPSVVSEIRYDEHQRLSFCQKKSLSYKWEFISHFHLHIHDFHTDGAQLIIPYIVFEDQNGDIFNEFSVISEIERRLFRKSEWFYAGSPSDIWNYLINGSIYDPRDDKKIKKRFKCQQCAYSWWNYFGLLKRETGKKLYTILQDEVAFSVLMDLSFEGEWGHGFWSDDIETHARFHLDGIHLLISQYEKTNDSTWLQGAERALGFVFENLTDTFNENQTWFLHDTIEHKKLHHFKNTIFGKSQGNSLCINTHVQALTVLNRLMLHSQEREKYQSAYDNGCNALRRVLEYRPGEVPYKLIGYLNISNKTRKTKKSKIGKIIAIMEKRLLNRIYWPVQRLYPRLVYPNGFIERDLTITMAFESYHVINIKDLLTLYKQDPLPWLDYFIREGTTYLRKFVREIGLPRNLAESPIYIEFVDILFLYSKLIESLPPEEVHTAEEDIFNFTGGYSIDFFASPLVR